MFHIKNKIFNEDVFEYLNRVPDESIDLAIVDPPYNIGIDEWDEFASEEAYFEFTKNWLDLTIKKLKPTGSIYLFNNIENSAMILNYLKSTELIYKNWIVWYKKDGFGPSKSKYVNNQEIILFYTKSEEYTFNYDDIRIPYESGSRMDHASKKGILKNGKRWFPNPKGKLCTDVWEFSSHRHKSKVDGKVVKSFHPTPKPEDMIERMILASSNKGDIVLDLFSGSGTTAYIAKKNGRLFTGCELSKEYFDYITKRLEL